MDKSRSSDGERILQCDYFIAGNSNPAVVPLAAVIFSHKIVLEHGARDNKSA